MHLKKTYRKIFIKYLSFAALLGLLLFGSIFYSVNALQNQALQTGMEVLQSGLARLEGELNRIYLIGRNISGDPHFSYLHTIPSDAVQPEAGMVEHITAVAKNYKASCELLQMTSDVGIVLPNGVVLSSNRVHMPTEKYYGDYFSAQDIETMEEWVRTVRESIASQCFSRMRITRYGTAEKDYFVFFFPLPMNSSNWKTFCFALLEEDALAASLSIQEQLAHGALSLYDHTGNLLLHKSAENLGPCVTLEAQSASYHLRARLSIEKSSFFAQISWFTYACLALCAGYLITSLALALLYTRRNARPIARMANAAATVLAPSEEEENTDAYEYMQRFISQVDSQLQQNRLALSSQELLIKENLMERLLRGWLFSSADCRLPREYFPDFPFPCVMTLARFGNVGALSPQDYSKLQIVIRKTAEQYIPRDALLHFSSNMLVILQAARPGMQQQGEALLSALRTDTGLETTLCVSRPFSGFDAIERVFNRLKHLLRFTGPEEGARLEGEEGEESGISGMQYPSKFYGHLIRNHLSDALAILDEELEAFRRSDESNETGIQQLFFSYRYMLRQAIQYANLSPGALALPDYNASASLDDLFRSVRACAAAICDAASRRETPLTGREKRMLSLIEQNLQNPDMNIAWLTAQLEMSEKAVQQLMRTATGMTFFEYLHHQRMARAKRLLVETDLPIQDISAQCGYASVNTFYKAFQRTYSTAPNAMRRERAAEN